LYLVGRGIFLMALLLLATGDTMQPDFRLPQ
jgi:hypothetical protein